MRPRHPILWLFFALTAAVSIALFFIPAFIIRPFTHQSATGLALAMALRELRGVRGVRWPGLPGDRSFELASRQMRRFGGVLCFELPSEAAVGRFLATWPPHRSPSRPVASPGARVAQLRLQGGV